MVTSRLDGSRAEGDLAAQVSKVGFAVVEGRVEEFFDDGQEVV